MKALPRMFCVVLVLCVVSSVSFLQEIQNSLAAGPWYVAPVGDDSNSCLSPAAPCISINGASAKAAPGDTILVASGRYTGSGSQVILLDKNIHLSGGWNNSFTEQHGFSIVDAEHARGGLMASNVSVYIERFVFQNGFAYGGAGLYSNGDLTLDHCQIVNNTATAYGGGIAVEGKLEIRFSTMSGNRTSGDGGGIRAFGPLVLENSTVSTNVSGGVGGGLHVYYTSPSAILYNNTITGNVAVSSGGIFIHDFVQDIVVQNTIIASNAGVSSPDCGGILVSTGYTLIGDTNGCDYAAGSGDLINVDPKIGNLIGKDQNPRYHPLLTGSPAINAGDPAGCSESQGMLSTDQRGAARADRCDIGAYEYTSPGPAATVAALNGTLQHAPPSQLFSQTLEAVVLDSIGSPVNGILVAFAAPINGASGTFFNTGTSTATTTTNESGVAAAPKFTANNLFGSYVVFATVSGVPTPAQFELSNIAWYVAPIGSDSNTCANPADPCRTISTAISKALPGDVLYAAEGLYTGTGNAVALIDRDLSLSGGWDSTFTVQNGFSTIDSEDARTGLNVPAGVVAQVDHFIIQNSPAGIDYMGVYCAGNLTLSNAKVRYNKMIGVYVRDATGYLTLNNSSVSANSGVGILINWAAEVTLNNSTIEGNGDSGIRSFSSYGFTPPTIILNNSTISGNKGDYAGGIDLYSFGSAGASSLFLSNTTISNNAGRGIANYISTIVAHNSIIAGNKPEDCMGAITSAGYNLIGDTTNCYFSPSTGDLIGMDPQTGVLIGNPEKPRYHPLMPGSPAIDAGAPAGCVDNNGAILETDQRGVARVGRCDIGAYEYTSPGPAETIYAFAGTPQRTIPGTSFPYPLQVVVLDSLGSPAAGATISFTAPATGASATFADSGTQTTTAITGESAIATSANVNANGIKGGYMVTGTISGSPVTAQFQLYNQVWYVSKGGNDSNDCLEASTSCRTVNGALAKTEFISGDPVYVSGEEYTGTNGGSILFNKNARVWGGWNNGFTSQTGVSTFDAQGQPYGIKILSNVIVSIEKVVVRGATENGVVSDGTLNMEDCIVTENDVSGSGAGIMIYNGSLTMKNCKVQRNIAKGEGGGIFNRGNVLLDHSTIERNLSGGGGGILNEKTLTVKDSTLQNNSADNGGGILNRNDLNMINSTIAGNTAKIKGGGIFAEGSVNLFNATISNNIATEGGGIFANNLISSYLTNTLLAGNAASTAPDCSGNLTSGDYNLIGYTTGCAFTPSGNDLTNLDAGVGRLIGFHGFPQYIPLLTGSLAINAGNPGGCRDHTGAILSYDQRGASRTGNCDIGSYEYVPAGPVTNISIFTGDFQHTPPSEPFPEPLGVVALDDIGTPVSNVLVTFTAPSSGPSGTFANSGTNTTTALSGLDGIAQTAVFTANSLIGKYGVTAEASGVLWPVSFSMNNNYLYIAPGGDDANDCLSSVTPCVTFPGVLKRINTNDIILAATGSYSSDPLSPDATVHLRKNIRIFGGWNATFSIQDGISTINGDTQHTGIAVETGVIAKMEFFTIQGGSGWNAGGVNNAGDLTLSDSYITGNSAYDGGGGIYNTGVLTLTNVALQDNTFGYSGNGGIHNLGNLFVDNSTISSNEGYGVFNKSSGVATLLDSIISDHSRGIDNDGVITMTHSIVSDNGDNHMVGGGILNSGNLLVEDSAITNNNGEIAGGVYNGGILNMNNSTISGNQAHYLPNGFGGGIYNNESGRVNIYNSTISDNSADYGGGVYNYLGGTVSMQNSLLAGNRSVIAGFDCTGTINSAGYNLIGNASNCAFNSSTGDLTNINPKLDSLEGLPGYHPLIPGSPAINAGNPAGCNGSTGSLGYDQRGYPRFGRCDIGAFELQPLEYSTKTTNPSLVRPNERVDFTITLQNPKAENINNVQVADTLPNELNYIAGSLIASGGIPQFANGKINWYGDIPANSYVTIQYGATVNPGTPLGSIITNITKIVGDGGIFYKSASVLVDLYKIFLPCVHKPCPPIYEDNFNNPNSGWPVEDDGEIGYEYLNGEYRILVRPAPGFALARPGFQANDYRVMVDVRNLNSVMGSYGILFGVAQDWSSFYSLEIYPDGWFGIYRYDPYDIIPLAEAESAAIHQGSAVNQLKVERDGSSIRAYANGQLLAEVTDYNYTGSRYIGLGVFSYKEANLDIRFDNFMVYPVSCGTANSPSKPVATDGEASYSRRVTILPEEYLGKHER
jgi:uncharacterized repeat protein (TIGR01451 family)